MKRGQGRMHSRECDWLKSLSEKVREVHRGLDREYLQLPELEPALTNAQEHVAQLEAWVAEMEWITEHELRPK